ncbi:MAG: class I SAM-dependent methyltransferase [Ferrovibrio sp.]|uniref:class I SAM-dependent methyltransferase n=1 Tax=Ferrovibrio sp. TaxID=1917215 RepID=UPI00391B0A62
MSNPASTAGYAGAADTLASTYESIRFEDVHRDILHLIPAPHRDGMAGRALDIGAGTGRDAAALARRGFAVTAAEPTAELREHGQRLHAGLDIRWLDDALPDLAHLTASGESFNLVMLTAVWMHLDATERERAMAAVAPLVAPQGRLALSLRHGPVPEGRRMFDVSADEVIAAGAVHDLALLHQSQRGDMFDRGDVHWDLLVLERPA